MDLAKALSDLKQAAETARFLLETDRLAYLRPLALFALERENAASRDRVSSPDTDAETETSDSPSVEEPQDEDDAFEEREMRSDNVDVDMDTDTDTDTDTIASWPCFYNS